jgi:hypothetical protein
MLIVTASLPLTSRASLTPTPDDNAAAATEAAKNRRQRTISLGSRLWLRTFGHLLTIARTSA